MEQESRMLAARTKANRAKRLKAAVGHSERLSSLKEKLKDSKAQYEVDLEKLHFQYNSRVLDINQERFRAVNDHWHRHQRILFSINQSINFHHKFFAETLFELCRDLPSDYWEDSKQLQSELPAGNSGGQVGTPSTEHAGPEGGDAAQEPHHPVGLEHSRNRTFRMWWMWTRIWRTSL
jgi:hypothetical protein